MSILVSADSLISATIELEDGILWSVFLLPVTGTIDLIDGEVDTCTRIKMTSTIELIASYGGDNSEVL